MQMKYLDRINGHADIAALDAAELPELCDELRTEIINSVSRTGGHLASSLGVIELTVALHRVFDAYRDRIIFDVGHQAYAHKLLTGRYKSFDTLRDFGGIGGFPDPEESSADPFRTGHASTSVSAALGMARARTLRGDDYSVIAVIGDGALTGGLAYEALADAGIPAPAPTRPRLLLQPPKSFCETGPRACNFPRFRYTVGKGADERGNHHV